MCAMLMACKSLWLFGDFLPAFLSIFGGCGLHTGVLHRLEFMVFRAVLDHKACLDSWRCMKAT